MDDSQTKMDGWMWVIYKGLVEWRGPTGVVENYTWQVKLVWFGVGEVSEGTLCLDM